MPLTDGEVFAGYTILRQLGSGGMGEVYLARHPRLPRLDALKILPAALTMDTEFRQRFNRESDLASSLWHPHIVGIHDRGEFNGQLWISMDYVDGSDADQLVHNHYPRGMPVHEALELAAAVAGALDYAHHVGLLHRDVKPSNILITQPNPYGRRIMLADFGIARRVDDINGLTTTNMAMGSVEYAAPEQLTGAVLDGRADQYALACTTFHLLTGTSPFRHSNPAVVIGAHLTAPPPWIAELRPDLAALGPILFKALAKDPRDRFASCTDFTAALAYCLGGQPIYPTATMARGSSKVWQRLALIIAGLVIIGAVIAGIVLLARDSHRSSAAQTLTTTSATMNSPVPQAPRRVIR